MTMPQRGEIWLADIPFTSGITSKFGKTQFNRVLNPKGAGDWPRENAKNSKRRRGGTSLRSPAG